MERENVAVILPCYRVRSQILATIAAIGPEVDRIYVVDDCCPEESGRHVGRFCTDPRVRILSHTENQGVGGAMTTGYRQALADGAAIIVKIDGDGQMDPRLLPRFLQPVLEGKADYTKGNRFFDLAFLQAMPRLRLLGNSLLSLVSKAASGYWNIMDPTNGYTVIHAAALERLPLEKLDRRYFFESDMLFRLGTIRAVVKDIPMEARYGEETSSLQVGRAAREFPAKFLLRFGKRIFYTYLLRDFNAGSLELLLSLVLLAFGGGFGAWHWYLSLARGIPATSGTVMLAALPILLGFQLLISAINYDIANVPTVTLQQSVGRLGPFAVPRREHLWTTSTSSSPPATERRSWTSRSAPSSNSPTGDGSC